jgi:hypothetical protein
MWQYCISLWATLQLSEERRIKKVAYAGIHTNIVHKRINNKQIWRLYKAVAYTQSCMTGWKCVPFWVQCLPKVFFMSHVSCCFTNAVPDHSCSTVCPVPKTLQTDGPITWKLCVVQNIPNRVWNTCCLARTQLRLKERKSRSISPGFIVGLVSHEHIRHNWLPSRVN